MVCWLAARAPLCRVKALARARMGTAMFAMLWLPRVEVAMMF